MQTVRMKKDYSDYKEGEEYDVQNNEAHALKEAGLAEIVRIEKEVKEVEKPEETKEMETKEDVYVCKYCGREFSSSRGLKLHLNYCDNAPKNKEMTAGKKKTYVTK